MPFIKHNCFARPLVYTYLYRESKSRILVSEVVQVSEVRFLYQKEIERPGKRENKGEGERERGRDEGGVVKL